jgi:hypothetical protein
MSAESYYTGLNRQLDRTAGISDYRVEVVPDGTHVAAYALLGHALLARGFETQSDNKFNAVLSSPTLDAVTFKVWLDNNAVGYVAIGRQTLKAGPEYDLVRSERLRYLTPVWSDAHWRLFKVIDPTPIAAPPAAMIQADQARLEISLPRAASIPLRIRWSRFLQVRGPDKLAEVTPDGTGWTMLVTHRSGTYVVTG